MVFRTTRALEKLCGIRYLNTGIMDLDSCLDIEFLVCFVILETIGLIPNLWDLLIEWYVENLYKSRKRAFNSAV
jgi:hypothetical protein